MKRKIGILTTYFASNYGAALQPFALKRTLENLGYDVEMIPYKQEDIYNHYNPLYIRRFIRKNLVKAIQYCFTLKYLLPRDRKFKSFVATYITNGVKKLSGQVPPDKDYYFIGSDQLWRTFGKDEHFDDVYCGFFKSKKGAKKIAYAVSGEHLDLNETNKKYLMSAFDNFDIISVREKKRANDFSAFYCKKEIEVIPDPTILVEPKIFNEITSINPLPNTDYVLFYCIRDKAINFIDKIKEYAQKANCRLLVLSEGYLPQLQSFSKKDTDILYLPMAGEEEFLGAMKNAKAVFTPSFHGNVFSILNHQNLFSLVLEDGHDTRANELLTQIGMGDRLFKITDQFIDRPVDYDAVDAEIQKLRTKALDFVKHSLS